MPRWSLNLFGRGNGADPHVWPPPSEKAVERKLEKLPKGAACFFDPFDPMQYPTDKRSVTVCEVVTPASSAEPTPRKEGEGDAAASPTSPEEEGFEWNGETDEPETPATAGSNSNADAKDSTGPDHQHTETEEELAERLKKERTLLDEMIAALEITVPEDEQKRFGLEINLLRFLRARAHNVEKAVEMYQTMTKWREEKGVDKFWDEAVDPKAKYFNNVCPHRNIGYDYEGHPIYYERTGIVRMPEMLKHITEEDCSLRHIRHMEHIGHRMQYLSHKFGRNITKSVIVCDLAGLSYSPDAAGIRVFKATIGIDQNYYPERLHKMFLINAPMSFRATWATIRVFIDHKTRQKIEVHGANYREHLRKHIPPSQLLVQFGGELELKYPNGDGGLPNVRPADSDEATEDWQPILEE